MGIKLNTIEELLAAINGIVGQASPLVPVISFAIRELWTMWKARNPDGTVQEFIDDLREKSESNQSFAAAWLIAHGYVLDPDGETWIAPPAADGSDPASGG
jgi:hypothetical protein